MIFGIYNLCGKSQADFPVTIFSYCNALRDRVVHAGDGESIVAELFATLTIDENDFLGVVIIVKNWEELKGKERLFNYLAETCAILSDFAYYEKRVRPEWTVHSEFVIKIMPRPIPFQPVLRCCHFPKSSHLSNFQ